MLTRLTAIAASINGIIRDKAARYQNWGWIKQADSSVKRNKDKWEQMFDLRKILFLPVHVEMVRMKIFTHISIRIMQASSIFKFSILNCLQQKFFIGPKIKIIESKELTRNLTTRVKATRNIFVTVVP